MNEYVTQLYDDGRTINEIVLILRIKRTRVIQILRNEVRLTPNICYRCKEFIHKHRRCPDCTILNHGEKCNCMMPAKELADRFLQVMVEFDGNL